MDDKDIKIDFLEIMKNTVDAKINKELLDAAEASGEEFAYNFIKLLNEYGIYGLKVHEFMAKMQMLTAANDFFGGGENEMP